MNSPHQREQLPDLLSDALDDAERARVESHLRECAQCEREMRALEQMQQSLASLSVMEPPHSIRANVRTALRENKRQVWTLASFLEVRARERRRVQVEKDTRRNPFQTGPSKAMSFVWGGAVALGTVGLMLLARPSLQNDLLSDSATIGETELASRAASGQATKNPKRSGKAADSRPSKASKPAAAKGKGKANPAAKSARKTEAEAIADLPPIPSAAPFPTMPPLLTPPKDPPASFDVTPFEETPADLSPAIPPAPPLAPLPTPLNQRDINQSDAAAKLPSKPATAKPRAPSVGRSTAPSVMPAPAPIAPPLAQAPSVEDSQPGESANFSANDALNGGAGDGAGNGAQSYRSRSSAVAPPSMMSRSREAPITKSPTPAAPAGWSGGTVIATMQRGAAAAGRQPTLTISVAKAIGDARLFLTLSGSETQVWRGSMNAVPIQINLSSVSAKLRSGQSIRARLEQIDNEGNPMGSTTFTIVWP